MGTLRLGYCLQILEPDFSPELEIGVNAAFRLMQQLCDMRFNKVVLQGLTGTLHALVGSLITKI